MATRQGAGVAQAVLPGGKQGHIAHVLPAAAGLLASKTVVNIMDGKTTMADSWRCSRRHVTLPLPLTCCPPGLGTGTSSARQSAPLRDTACVWQLTIMQLLIVSTVSFVEQPRAADCSLHPERCTWPGLPALLSTRLSRMPAQLHTPVLAPQLKSRAPAVLVKRATSTTCMAAKQRHSVHAMFQQLCRCCADAIAW